MKVLAINAGSSSLKYQLMDFQTNVVLAKGLCERIGIDGALSHKVPCRDQKIERAMPMPTHTEALQAVLQVLVDGECGVISNISEIAAVGHRIAHGGEFFTHSALVNAEVRNALQVCMALAPLHNHANIMGIEACEAVLGEKVPQVAVFDTAFHQSMPPVACTYALPYRYYETDKVRRYGFHGTSHRYVAARAAELMEQPIESLKLVSCHLGNGSSIAAIAGGVSVDTSMGFTPLAGLPMGTRSGDVDAGVMKYLMDRHHLSIGEMLDVLNKESGVLGISGISSDFRDLGQAAAEGNERAQLALDVFAYSVRKYIGSYAFAMGGLDGVIFTAGVGENDCETRSRVCEGLEFAGIALDQAINQQIRGCEAFISSPKSSVKVMVIPTDEELMIACDTAAIVKSL